MGRLPRLRARRTRTVSRARQTLVRPEQRLHWELSPVADEKDDYRLRLVGNGGAPAPPIFCTLSGRPTLYLTADAVFTGPNPQPHVLDPAGENRIPAPALERAAGVAFLQSLNVELPERVRDRVRVLPYQVAITCRLQPIYPWSSAAECIFTVLAEAPDSHQH